MLWTLRDEAGRLQAACEWQPVDEGGRFNPEGRYVWIEQLEIAFGADGRTILRCLIADLAWQRPQALGAYWKRRDRSEERLHGYRRDQLTREEVLV